MILFKKVCEDIVKCLQVLPSESVVYRVYQNAIGKENMAVLNSFGNLPMYNFGVTVQKEMEDVEKAYLEQNIQASLAQKELDIEDAIAIRNMKDINQAERLLVVRRKKRIQRLQQMAAQNAQVQSEQAQQAAVVASQAKQQEMQMEAQLEAQTLQLKNELEIQLEAVKHQYRREIEMIRAQATLGFREDDQNFREKIEVFKAGKKDERVDKQKDAQKEIIDKRKGQETTNQFM